MDVVQIHVFHGGRVDDHLADSFPTAKVGYTQQQVLLLVVGQYQLGGGFGYLLGPLHQVVGQHAAGTYYKADCEADNRVQPGVEATLLSLLALFRFLNICSISFAILRFCFL